MKQSILKNKRLIYGTASTLLATFVIIIAMLINIAFENFNIRFDITQNQMYTLSQTSIDILDDIQTPVRIYTLAEMGSETNMITMLVNQYDNINNISVVNRDPVLNPAFFNQFSFEMPPVNSIIVASENRYTVLHPVDLFISEWHPLAPTPMATHFIAEPAVTNAILYVLSEHLAYAYEITGHGIIPLDGDFLNLLAANGYTHQTINLMVDTIPQNADLLIFSTPATDITPAVADAIIGFLHGGGRAFFAIETVPDDFYNVRRVLNTFGIEPIEGFINEMPGRHAAGAPPFFVHPLIQSHTITADIAEPERFMLLLAPMGLATAEFLPIDYVFEPLLASTGQSFLRYNPEIVSPGITEYDIPGPFTMAAAIETGVSRLVVVSSATLLDNDVNFAVLGTNGEFFINSLHWLMGVDATGASSVNIPPVSITTDDFLNITQQEYNVLSFIAMGALPGVVLLIGVVVWFRRRNR